MTSTSHLFNASDDQPITDHFALAPGNWDASADPMTEAEQKQLAICERIIESGLKVWSEVGDALLQIRDHRLYRATHTTFVEYLRQRWQMSSSQAYRLMDAAKVTDNLSPMGEILTSERQARALVPYTPDDQRLIVDVACEMLGPQTPTAADLTMLGTVLNDLRQTAFLDDGAGRTIPLAHASPAHIKAAVIQRAASRFSRSTRLSLPRGIPPALVSSDSWEWYTPLAYIQAIHTVLGHIDVDPASSAEANRVVQAQTFYDATTNGFAHDWPGHVFLNPPYGRAEGENLSNQQRWSARLLAQYQAGITTEAILLVNAITDSGWFQPLWDYPICFTDHRIPFQRPGGQPGVQPVRGSAFVYLGPNPERFAAVFCPFGPVVLHVMKGGGL